MTMYHSDFPKIKFLIFTVLIFCVHYISYAQNFATVFPKKNYPTDQFHSPVSFPIVLAGNYGECRPGHFHSGLDIKTQQVENKPIKTIGFGYVYRVKISHTGFGNALYVVHPGGYVSLYAHLNSFSPRIQKVVERYQYAQQKWNIDVEIPPYELILNENEQIALSGNTGSSTAPHLHLEIRDSQTEKTLNPWLFGFNIPDHKAPVLSSLGIYDLHSDEAFYSQKALYKTIVSQGKNQYSLSAPLVLKASKVGFSVDATDYMDGNGGKLGVFETQLYVDGKLHFAWQVDDISYDETRYLHAFADYDAHLEKKKWYECAFRLPGNHLNIYNDAAKKNGAIDISDGKKHQIEMRLYDVLGNQSTLKFTVQGDTEEEKIKCDEFDVDEINEYESDSMLLLFPEYAFYSICCPSFYLKNGIYSLGDEKIPLQDYYSFILKNGFEESYKDKYVLQKLDDESNAEEGQAMVYENGTLKCEGYREFGNFKLLVDTKGPEVTSKLKNNTAYSTGSWLTFAAKDDATSLQSFDVYANGQWLCFIRRGNNYRYKIDSHCPRGNVHLKAIAKDASNNTTIKEYDIRVN